MSPQTVRETIAKAKRVVVKIGSSSITHPDNFAVDAQRIDHIVDAIATRLNRGSEVIVVSSGAIATGMGPLNLTTRPRDLATKQAAATVGQVHLAYEWGRSLGRYGITAGQVLLTAGDMGQRDRARNAQRALARLSQLGCVPIINENDAVATSEINLGDNDRLSSLVARLTAADALILLSDVDGLYDRNPVDPTAKFISSVKHSADLNGVEAGGGGVVGTGGMASKVSAARIAARGGIPVLLTSAENIGSALADAQVGTVFHPEENCLSAWKFWALYAADSEGTLHLDAGAKAAISRGGNSLLAVGITEISGDFHAGQIVDMVGPQGEFLGRGEVAYESNVLATMLGKHSHELPETQSRPVIHADYLSNLTEYS
ncbi:glutamate 5-kinase [Corynebacterium caspium]|uniref:glutamate 5-kinase n=1 Tax=Corynebacterium caspium TaxID=234828 RepID=UPI00036635F0|nr:glutamate 5-kinase [Corynebacterium caspium]WKD58851.1 Glutamate 5-kinase [Corynebacterium caspium DSM 44850]